MFMTQCSCVIKGGVACAWQIICIVKFFGSCVKYKDSRQVNQLDKCKGMVGGRKGNVYCKFLIVEWVKRNT